MGRITKMTISNPKRVASKYLVCKKKTNPERILRINKMYIKNGFYIYILQKGFLNKYVIRDKK